MLKQRVITALALLLVLIPAVLYPDARVFSALMLLVIAAAGWEWARMNDAPAIGTLAGPVLCLGVCGGVWWSGFLQQTMVALWLTAGALWVLTGAWVLRTGVAAWSGHSRSLRLGLGWLALCLTWLAVVQARLVGVNFLMSVLALVWVADIGAYFSGRAFGGKFTRSKLAASISPGKSWEGVWGGMLGVVVLAFGWQYADAVNMAQVPSLYTVVGQHGWGLLLLVAVFLSLMSVVGDLVESLVKRSAGVKDSSGLLPGHGGVLDRIDALLPTLPLAMMLYVYANLP
ncbi:MAG: phosphatidate cytidylyltransferase [Rhodoferax sp.]|uniref:phosphatidate cytidylyltransferase n=1 Tax=Rhodoferax sp. TaxID=50421 RepID=UPI001B416DA0|nr:phosphatidate cytidylyltransferase [Rhodoferax sp.]MBP9904445.1 phosphatidate cytidylyltransferase [Rhodoferax sp.]